MSRSDPYVQFRFLIEIDGIRVGGFRRVSGIERVLETEDIREGGRNFGVLRLATGVTQTSLVLEHGLGDSTSLWTWIRDAAAGRIRLRDVSVVLVHATSDQRELRRWKFTNAYPTKWSGGEFDAMSGEVLTERVELAYEELVA